MSQYIFAQGEREFPFPHIPDMIVEPQQRASWLLNHYWDNVDFNNAKIISDTAFIEQAFVNFLSIMPIVESDKNIENGVKTLMQKVEKNLLAFDFITFLSEKYLYEPNSPLLNEKYYLYFLNQINVSNLWSDIKKSRTKYQYKVITLNQPGTKATNFSFMTTTGVKSTLHSIVADELIVIFYDPECDNCTNVINKLANNPEINNRIVLGKTKVLAVYPDGKYDVWQTTISKMPKHWIVALSTSSIQPLGNYIFRAMPTIYILDKDKIVLEKDVRL